MCASSQLHLKMRLRMLQIVHRHGDRLPLYNAFGDECIEELNRWKGRLASSEMLSQLGNQFPVENENITAKDRALWPFGHLTQRGLDQMVNRGSRLRSNYLSDLMAHEELTPRNVRTHSTNYARTTQSAQGLLLGLFHDTFMADQDLPIRVPVSKDDIINTYEVYPEIPLLKAQHAQESLEFQERERSMDVVRGELIQQVPFLTAENFNWMKAADYFWCRKAHGIPCIGQTEEYEQLTIQHLSYRFQQLYGNKRILRLVAGRLVYSIISSIHLLKSGASKDRLILYSGHDVSIVAVLHALGADIVHETKWWPDYAASIEFKVFESDDGMWFVEICMNGQPLSFRGSPQVVPLHELDLMIQNIIS